MLRTALEYLRENDQTIVKKNEGSGKIINSIFYKWNKIKNQKQHDDWEKLVKNTKFGTYGTLNFIEVMEKLEPKFPNEIIKRDFYNEIQNVLRK